MWTQPGFENGYVQEFPARNPGQVPLKPNLGLSKISLNKDLKKPKKPRNLMFAEFLFSHDPFILAKKKRENDNSGC